MVGPSHLDHLVDRQMALWELKQRSAASGRESLLARSEGPWITISSQLGANGGDLAKRLAERLGWQVFDKEILQAIARETHTKEKILSRLDGHAVSGLDDYLAHLLVPEDPGQPAYLHELMRVICAVAKQGHAIFLGRGANWLLDPRHGLRVRGIAPLDQRVEQVARALGISAHAARRRVDEDDVDRAKFIRQVYRKAIDDPLAYDLVLNLGTMRVDTAVEAVLIALDRKALAAA